ncbi:MAG: hypothetical protein AMJ43_05630 [Coxiella sp. DG_40]|nr:MAG: hypothetical protein AMJ43_05630 [Coxiella sp. DG_40]
MIERLKNKKILVVNDEEGTFALIDEYLMWFGRYYCPLPKYVDKTIRRAYTEPDSEGMVSFKYQPKYPETHKKLDTLFKELWPPNVSEDALTWPSLHFF